MVLSPYIIVILSALAGFAVAFYIHHHKRQSEKKLVCLVGSDCDAVIHSKYAVFLGIPVETLGMFYYGLIVFLYGAFIFLPHLANQYLVFLVVAMTTAALLFSSYLTFIQAFLLRQWCAWCLFSAGLCAIIFFTAIFGSEFTFIQLLSIHRLLIVVLHGIGAAIGLGGATISDFLFFRFLRDGRVSEWESEVLHSLSQVIWLALGILVITGIALYLPQADILNQSSKFLAKVAIVLVIIINGAFLNLFISPKLVHISFGERHPHEAGELRALRRSAFAMGAISIISWYSAFILGMLRVVPLTVWGILGIYLLLVGVAIAVSQIVENRLASLS